MYICIYMYIYLLCKGLYNSTDPGISLTKIKDYNKYSNWLFLIYN